jgi:hypothetical protein
MKRENSHEHFGNLRATVNHYAHTRQRTGFAWTGW